MLVLFWKVLSLDHQKRRIGRRVHTHTRARARAFGSQKSISGVFLHCPPYLLRHSLTEPGALLGWLAIQPQAVSCAQLLTGVTGAHYYTYLFLREQGHHA